jgi:uncharacterized protein YjlB
MLGKQFKTGLNNILHFVTYSSHTHDILIIVQYRCELFDWCCVGNEVYCCSGDLEENVNPFKF